MRRQESERAEPHATAIAGREGLCARPHGQLHAPKALIFKRSFVGSLPSEGRNEPLLPWPARFLRQASTCCKGAPTTMILAPIISTNATSAALPIAWSRGSKL